MDIQIVEREQRRTSSLTGRRRAKIVRVVAGWQSFRKQKPEDVVDLGVDPYEVATVIRVQRFFRFRVLLYQKMGPSFFHRKDRQADGTPIPADHGTLTFGTLESTRKPAPFITVSDEVEPLELLRFLEKSWRLPTPELIISVTGGAQDFSPRSCSPCSTVGSRRPPRQPRPGW